MGLIDGLSKGVADLAKGAVDLAKGAADAVEAKKEEIRENSLEKSRQKDAGWSFRMELDGPIILMRGVKVEVRDRDGNLMYKVKPSTVAPSKKIVIDDASGNKLVSLSLSLIKGPGVIGVVDAFPYGRVVQRKPWTLNDEHRFYRLEGTNLWLNEFGDEFFEKSTVPLVGYDDPIAIVHTNSLFEDAFIRINYNDRALETPLLVLYSARALIFKDSY